MPGQLWLYPVCKNHDDDDHDHDGDDLDDDDLGDGDYGDASFLQISSISEHLCQTVWPTL